MKTDDLISMLAAGEPAMDRLAMAKRFALALLVGGVAAVVGSCRDKGKLGHTRCN